MDLSVSEPLAISATLSADAIYNLFPAWDAHDLVGKDENYVVGMPFDFVNWIWGQISVMQRREVPRQLETWSNLHLLFLGI